MGHMDTLFMSLCLRVFGRPQYFADSAGAIKERRRMFEVELEKKNRKR